MSERALHQEEETPEAQEAVSIVRARARPLCKNTWGAGSLRLQTSYRAQRTIHTMAELAHLLREWVQKDFAGQGWRCLLAVVTCRS